MSLTKTFLAAKTTTKTKSFSLANYLNRRRVTCLTFEFYLSFYKLQGSDGSEAEIYSANNVVYKLCYIIFESPITLIQKARMSASASILAYLIILFFWCDKHINYWLEPSRYLNTICCNFFDLLFDYFLKFKLSCFLSIQPCFKY